MIRGIIFDMDGVMIDSERQSNHGWLSAAEEKGVEMPMRLINIFKGAPPSLSQKHFDEYFHGKLDYWDMRRLRSEYVRKLRETEGIPVKKGLYELLEYSRDSGIKCAVATSTQRKSAYNTLHVIGAWDYLSAVVFGDEVAGGKPEPDIFLKAAGDLALEPSECIVIEDSINGIRAGYNAGIRVVHVPDTIIIDDDIRGLTSAVCGDLREVIGIIEQWGGGPASGKYADKRDNIDGSEKQSYADDNDGNTYRPYRCVLKYAFLDYVNSYNIQEDRIRLKIEHTYRVASLCERIAKSLGLNSLDIDTAWFTGMFHDIGRFEQVKRYGTFDDSVSVDHAKLSSDIIFGTESEKAVGEIKHGAGVALLRRRIAESSENIDMHAAMLAIREHNSYRLPLGLSYREKMFCDILRDADKIDILKVCVEEPAEAVYSVTEEELRGSDISEEVLKAFCEEKTVLKRIRKTAADKLVGHISLVYELVYPESIAIAKNQGYLDRLLEFRSGNAEARERFKLIKSKMEQFCLKNCEEGDFR